MGIEFRPGRPDRSPGRELLAELIATHGHNGGLAGAFSNMFQLDDGYSFAIIGNQDLVQGACEDSVTRFLNILNTIDWPEHDLF